MFSILKKSYYPESYSSLHLLKSSYPEVNHPNLNTNINSNDIKTNGFLLSNEEKGNLLFYMAFHRGINEKISSNSLLNNNPGAVLINRSMQTIYKIYHPETIEEKKSRKEIAKDLGINLKAKGVIGQGGFGKLRICQDLISGKFYAVKIIKKSLIARFGYFIGFNGLYKPYEISFLKQEKQFIDCIETAGKFYVIEKLIDGIGLDKFIWHAEDDDEKIYIFFEILMKMVDAVANFHADGCIHRDISPDNSLYDQKENKIYLIDFGFALTLPKGYRTIYIAEVLGKKGFIAPEIMEASFAAQYGYASDIYALGQTINYITNEFSDQLKNHYNFVSQGLYSLVSEMKANDPHHRPNLFSIKEQIKRIRTQALNERNNSVENGVVIRGKNDRQHYPSKAHMATRFSLFQEQQGLTFKNSIEQEQPQDISDTKLSETNLSR